MANRIEIEDLIISKGWSQTEENTYEHKIGSCSYRIIFRQRTCEVYQFSHKADKWMWTGASAYGSCYIIPVSGENCLRIGSLIF